MPKINSGAYRPELDDMTPAQIRVLCEELLYTMDSDQRCKIATKLPGIYKMVFDSAPAVMTEVTANKIAFHMNEAENEPIRKVNPKDVHNALIKVGL